MRTAANRKAETATQFLLAVVPDVRRHSVKAADLVEDAALLVGSHAAARRRTGPSQPIPSTPSAKWGSVVACLNYALHDLDAAAPEAGSMVRTAILILMQLPHAVPH